MQIIEVEIAHIYLQYSSHRRPYGWCPVDLVHFWVTVTSLEHLKGGSWI